MDDVRTYRASLRHLFTHRKQYTPAQIEDWIDILKEYGSIIGPADTLSRYEDDDDLKEKILELIVNSEDATLNTPDHDARVGELEFELNNMAEVVARHDQVGKDREASQGGGGSRSAPSSSKFQPPAPPIRLSVRLPPRARPG